MMNLQLSNFNYFISRNTTGYDIFSHKLMFAKITPEGIYIKADRKQTEFEYLSLKDIRIYLEDKPKDPNRFKAINQSWMPWADHRDLEGMNTRMVVNATKDNIPVSYVSCLNAQIFGKNQNFQKFDFLNFLGLIPLIRGFTATLDSRLSGSETI